MTATALLQSSPFTLNDKTIDRRLPECLQPWGRREILMDIPGSTKSLSWAGRQPHSPRVSSLVNPTSSQSEVRPRPSIQQPLAFPRRPGLDP